MRFRILAQRTSRSSPFDPLSLRAPSISASPRQPCHLIFLYVFRRVTCRLRRYLPLPLLTGIRTPPGTPNPTMVQTPTSRSTSSFALDNATDDELYSMDATQLHQFILTARTSPYPASGATTPSVNLFPSFSSLTSSPTPKMDRVRQSVASVGVTTYLGSFDLMDSQASFDSIFGDTPVMLRVTRRAAGSCATEEIEYLAKRINAYCDLCQLHLFCSIVKLQFVGTEDYDTHRMMHNIYLALSELKLLYKSQGKLVTLTPDTLYQQFIEFSPLLPPNATTWSFSLVTLFYNSLSVELQESIRLAGYILLDNSNLSTISSQTSTLQILREKSVVAHKLLCEEKQRVISILHSVSPHNARIHPMISQAEETIRSHTSTPDTNTQLRPSRPLVIGKDGKSYPMNPITNYIS